MLEKPIVFTLTAVLAAGSTVAAVEVKDRLEADVEQLQVQLESNHDMADSFLNNSLTPTCVSG